MIELLERLTALIEADKQMLEEYERRQLELAMSKWRTAWNRETTRKDYKSSPPLRMKSGTK